VGTEQRTPRLNVVTLEKEVPQPAGAGELVAQA